CHVSHPVVLVRILVRSAKNSRTTDLGFVQRCLDLDAGATRTIRSKPAVEFPPFLRLRRRRVLGTGFVAVDLGIESKKPRNSWIDCAAKGPDEHPAVLALERVVGLKRGAIAGVSVMGTLAGVQGHAIPLGLSYCLELGQIDDLASTRFTDLP